MDDVQFRASVMKAFDRFRTIGLTDWDRLVERGSLRNDADFNRVAFDPTKNYEDVYLAGLRLRQYNFVMADLSFFQFARDGRPNNPILRYGYYPNPFEDLHSIAVRAGFSGVEEIFNNGDIYDQVLAEADLRMAKPPLRFEHVSSAYRAATHPAAHLHVGVYKDARLLTPCAFSLFVAKQYYAAEWLKADVEAATADGYSNSLDQDLASEKAACRVVEVATFGPLDERHLYIS